MKWIKGFPLFLLVVISIYITVSLVAPEKVFSFMMNLQLSGVGLTAKEISTADL